MLHSLKTAFRVFSRRRGFALAVACTLGLGLGAALCAVTVSRAALFEVLPFPKPDRLLWIENRGAVAERAGISIPQLRRWQAGSRTLSAVAAYTERAAQLTDRDGVSAINVALVSPHFFAVFAVSPLFGRTVRMEGDREGSASIALVSFRFWKQHLRGDTGALGSHVVIDGVGREIVGVMPASFAFPSDDIDIWTPLLPALEPFSETEGIDLLSAIGRLASGSQLDAVARDLGTVDIVADASSPGKSFRPYAESLRDHMTRALRPRLYVLCFTAGLVLLLTWANAGIMLVNRQLARRHELLVRSALGAERSEIFRLVFFEAVLLSLAGVVLGGAVLKFVLSAAHHSAPAELPELINVHFDSGFAIEVVVLALVSAAMISGIALLETGRSQPIDVLRGNGLLQQSTRAGTRARFALVIASVAASVVLVSTAASLARTFQALARTRMGFDANQVFRMRLDLPITVLTPTTRDGVAIVMSDLLTRMKSTSGFSTVAIATESPGGGNRMASRVSRGDREEAFRAGVQAVSADYFTTLRMRLVAGRGFGPTDGEGDGDAEVPAVVDASFARSAFVGADAVGKLLDLSDLAMTIRIIGVVPDVRQQSPTAERMPQVFLPYRALPLPWVTLLVKSSLAGGAVQKRLNDIIKEAAPHQPVGRLEALSSVLAARIDTSRFYAVLLLAFAFCSVSVSLIGLYGVISLSVAQRRTEFGIRMSLGATGTRLFGMVIGSCLRMTGIGILLGVVLTVASSRLVAAILFGENPLNPWVVAACCATISGIAIIAGFIPARRASTMNPASLLRSE